jgi:hypothetical protein
VRGLAAGRLFRVNNDNADIDGSRTAGKVPMSRREGVKG